ncbi:MAG TPA: phosphonate C-P lyase system protein PhnH [Alphaproteobacteria bacterium]|nr:phosphonate C-P lyase system protein PhnH [Alphaproteobacteria bacterium]
MRPVFGRASGGLLPGFADPVGQTQQSFRAVMDAMARPGQVRELARPEGVPEGWPSALAALALTLLDQDTPVWLDRQGVSEQAAAYLRFHCGCPVVPECTEATFAVILDTAAAPPLHAFSIGDALYPEQSATLIMTVQSFEGGPTQRWTGPGIKKQALVSPKGLPPQFVPQWSDNHALYPSGIDIILVAGDAVMALPRSVSVEEG